MKWLSGHQHKRQTSPHLPPPHHPLWELHSPGHRYYHILLSHHISPQGLSLQCQAFPPALAVKLNLQQATRRQYKGLASLGLSHPCPTHHVDRFLLSSWGLCPSFQTVCAPHTLDLEPDGQIRSVIHKHGAACGLVRLQLGTKNEGPGGILLVAHTPLLFFPLSLLSLRASIAERWSSALPSLIC